MSAENKFFRLNTARNPCTLSADMPLIKMKQIIGENVRRLRKESQRSVDDFAEEAGCARGYWYEVEAGATNPTLDMLAAIARALGVSVRDLFETTVFAQDGIPRASKKRKAS